MHPLAEIEYRVKNKPTENLLTVASTLLHFSIVSYLVEPTALRKHVPPEYELYTLVIDGKKWGLVSAVSFVNKNFRFKNLFPFLQSKFGQTNYRVYIKDKKGENSVWFLGTGLGSSLVHLPRLFWKMPWFHARYATHVNHPETCMPYNMQIKTKHQISQVDLTEDEIPQFTWEGFSSREEALLVLTHPVTGYFKRNDGRVSRYGVWHSRMDVKTARPGNIYFEKFEHWGLLTRADMLRPYSVLITPSIHFQVYLPPRKL
jgi:hypothetical protein